MIAASPAEQRRLLDLQRVDTTVHQLEYRRAHLPEQQALDENSDTLGKVAAEFRNATEQLERLTVQQRRHESEIATIDSRRKSEEGRMYSGLIKSEKEHEALRHELSSLRIRKGDLEDALLEIMEQVEELDSLTSSLRERHGELTAQVAQLTDERDLAATDIDEELATQVDNRKRVVKDLPEPVVKFYEDVRARKAGVAVAELRGRTCSGCRLQLTAIELEDVKADSAKGLARCEQCGRILVPVSSAP